jgi:hypothetical protein
VAVAITGLLLDAHPTQTRVSNVLPARTHEAHNCPLRLMPFSTRPLMALLMAFVRCLGCPGYVIVDDVIVEKAYARRVLWAGWTYSHAKQRKLYGLHIVVLLSCSHDGQWRIPVGFRL